MSRKVRIVETISIGRKHLRIKLAFQGEGPTEKSFKICGDCNYHSPLFNGTADAYCEKRKGQAGELGKFIVTFTEEVPEWCPFLTRAERRELK